MITKTILIAQIRKAYTDHIKWRSTAKAMHMGICMYDSSIESSPKECDFGKWYYNEGQVLSKISFYKDIEILHNRIHQIYQSILKLKQRKKKKSILHLHVEDEYKDKMIIAAYFKDLTSVSKDLLFALKELEAEVNRLDSF